MELTSLLQSSKPGASARRTDTTGDVREDAGPFFDLEFAAPTDGEERRRKERWYSLGTDSDSESDESASESGSSVRRDHILSLSPSDDLFFKGRLLPLEPSARLSRSSSSASTYSKPQVAAFLLKSAAKLRVFRLGIRKKSPRSSSADDSAGTSPAAAAESPKLQRRQRESKFMSEEPAASIFTRSGSSFQSSGSKRSTTTLFPGDGLAPSEEKKINKDFLRRYLNKMKPLYVQVSKRYGDMLRFSGPLSSGEVRKVRPATEGSEEEGSKSSVRGVSVSQRPQKGSIPLGLKVVSRRLKKSRSAASASVNAVGAPAPVASGRQDDSLLAQQDGIQSAIAHCKRSFSRGSESSEPPLTRSLSEPSDGRPVEASAKDQDS